MSIPEEPELMRLWRMLIEVRDEVAAAIPKWESVEHPDRVYLAKVAARSGGDHGRTDRELREIDAAAVREAKALRRRLREIDSAVAGGTRDKGNQKRSLGIEQLRALIMGPDVAESRRRAEEALEAWWVDRENRGKRYSARLALYRLKPLGEILHGPPPERVRAIRARSIPTSSSELPDLDALLAEDRKYCREAVRRGRAKPGSTAKAVIPRIIRRIGGEGVK